MASDDDDSYRIASWVISRQTFTATPIYANGDFGADLDLSPLFVEFARRVANDVVREANMKLHEAKGRTPPALTADT